MEYRVEFPVLYSRTLLIIYFIYSSVCMSIPISQSIPPLPILTTPVATSCSSLVAQRLKRLPPMRETQLRSQGREDPLEKELVTHSSILTWRIPWMEKPGRLQSMGLQRVGHDWATSLACLQPLSLWTCFCFVNKFISIIFFKDSAYK